jgi:hypothetical protein
MLKKFNEEYENWNIIGNDFESLFHEKFQKDFFPHCKVKLEQHLTNINQNEKWN